MNSTKIRMLMEMDIRIFLLTNCVFQNITCPISGCVAFRGER